MTETRVKSKKNKSSSVYKKKLYQMSHMYREQFNVLSSEKNRVKLYHDIVCIKRRVVLCRIDWAVRYCERFVRCVMS